MSGTHYKCSCGWHGREDEVDEKRASVPYEAHGSRAYETAVTVICPACHEENLDECYLCECCGENPRDDDPEAEGLCEFCLNCDEDEQLDRRRSNPKHRREFL